MAVTPFSVDLANAKGQTVVRLVGELDSSQAEYAETQARRALVAGATGPVIIDVSELTFCDARGVRSLLNIEAAARRQDRDVQMRRPGRAVTRILEALGLDSHFTIESGNNTVSVSSSEGVGT